MTNLITEARELCEKAKIENDYAEPVYGSDTYKLIMKCTPELCDALEKANKELKIVYALADNMARGTHNAAQAYEDWVHAGETVYEEGE